MLMLPVLAVLGSWLPVGQGDVLAGSILREMAATVLPGYLWTTVWLGLLVALGAAIFVLVPLQGGMQVGDISRVLQGVIAGIGFLGAGAIIKLSDEREIRGLTTSASIWMTAAIGVAAGMGREATALVSTLMALFVLAVLRRVEARISSRQEKNLITPGTKSGGNA